MIKTTTSQVQLPCFVHFFAVTARLRLEITSGDVLWRTQTQAYKFLFLPLNLAAVPKNSIPGKFTNI